MPIIEKYELKKEEITTKNVAIILKDLAVKLDNIGRTTGFKDEGYDDFYECIDGVPTPAFSIESLYKKLTGQFLNRTTSQTNKPEATSTPEEIYEEINKLIDVANKILKEKTSNKTK